MTVLAILAICVVAIAFFGSVYSRFLARGWGEDPARPTPAVRVNDGRDFVPTPTTVVFAHHFASIAGAGPIIGPVIAVCYGWLPALAWIVLGGILIGGVHDYLASFMSLREGGRSVATVARRVLGNGPFLGLVLFIVLSLALVCATFLNLSATALVSMVPHARLGLPAGQTLFRVVGEGETAQVVIGGIASTSVIVITMLAPIVGWMYIRKQIAVWKCSMLAVAVCALGLTMGLVQPVSVSETVWKLVLAVYVLAAAGLPVWILLQSRDFINVHILYIGLAGLTASLVVAGFRGAGPGPEARLPAIAIGEGSKALGLFWPGMFITIACGAVSGFHSLCAGGTTCKQLRTEKAARQVGYWAMLLETALAAAVVCVLLMGLSRGQYMGDVHPKSLGLAAASNPILAFALAVGNTVRSAFGFPVAIGALAGMVLLEGFLVTTLDTAVRLMRYLLEEIWRVCFGIGMLHPPVRAVERSEEGAGACGLVSKMELGEESPPLCPVRPPAWLDRLVGNCVFNSALAVGLTLWFAMSAGILSLWQLFATSNQLLAAFVLGLGTVWLVRAKRIFLPALIPALLMLATAARSLVMLARKFSPSSGSANTVLFTAALTLMALTAYLLVSGTVSVVRLRRAARAGTGA
ncbi:MAG: hypothetical protein FJ224_06625 [Lentisphaerae bacterium]|nr:hypothetical protein [Lentisphaerota bacterium]